jgi:hypothetical protein
MSLIYLCATPPMMSERDKKMPIPKDHFDPTQTEIGDLQARVLSEKPITGVFTGTTTALRFQAMGFTTNYNGERGKPHLLDSLNPRSWGYLTGVPKSDPGVEEFMQVLSQDPVNAKPKLGYRGNNIYCERNSVIVKSESFDDVALRVFDAYEIISKNKGASIVVATDDVTKAFISFATGMPLEEAVQVYHRADTIYVVAPGSIEVFRIVLPSTDLLVGAIKK